MRQSDQKNTTKISDFLFAGKKLRTPAIVNLLISSSFGLNAVFYAAWLGYSIGIWGLLLQLAWSISFFLLIPAAKSFTDINSLHDFLGRQFGNKTKLLAALCSLVGMSYFVVWEVNIDQSTIAPLLKIPPHFLISDTSMLAALIIGLFALITIIYTILWGLRGNAITDRVLNSVKVVILIAISCISLYHFFRLPNNLIFQSIFPPFSKVITNLGILGLITNIVFNLAWQFVDNTSWQTIIGGAKASNGSTARNLKYSGLLIFLVVNLLATILGISLAQQSNVTQGNIIAIAAGLLPQLSTLLSIGIIILSIASMMSLIDGMLLASALTVNIDILPIKALQKLSETKRLRLIQLSVFAFGLIAVWIINLVFNILHINLFDLVYIVILSQLSLIGPVIIGLYSKRHKNSLMWIAILTALIVGFGSTIIGGASNNHLLVDGAGAFAVVASLFTAGIVKYLPERIMQHSLIPNLS